MSLGQAELATLPQEAHDVLRGYVKTVTTHFGDNLQAVLLYGSAARGEFLPGRSNLNLLLQLEKPDPGATRTYADVHRRWAAERVVAPLLVTDAELEGFPDAFPLETLELQRFHVVLAGRDPLPQGLPDPQRLARQCHRELRANVLLVRQRVIEQGAGPDVIEALLPLCVTALLSVLRTITYLEGRLHAKTAEDVLAALAAGGGTDCGAVEEAWNIKTGVSTAGRHELPRLLERYLATVAQLADRARLLAERAP